MKYNLKLLNFINSTISIHLNIISIVPLYNNHNFNPSFQFIHTISIIYTLIYYKFQYSIYTSTLIHKRSIYNSIHKLSTISIYNLYPQFNATMMAVTIYTIYTLFMETNSNSKSYIYLEKKKTKNIFTKM